MSARSSSPSLWNNFLIKFSPVLARPPRLPIVQAEGPRIYSGSPEFINVKKPLHEDDEKDLHEDSRRVS